MLLVLAGLAAVRGLAANYEIGYEIMNGDFQNYNPVRHLLAGQVPYRDFTVYLGAGELYSVGGLLLVLGNSFGRSMFATNFCTWFYFELLVLAVCLVVIGTARAARTAALALALTNQVLSATGHRVLPIESAELEQLVSTGLTIATSVAAWWKNNSFTPEAIEADAFMARMKKRVR